MAIAIYSVFSHDTFHSMLVYQRVDIIRGSLDSKVFPAVPMIPHIFRKSRGSKRLSKRKMGQPRGRPQGEACTKVRVTLW